MYVKCCFCFFFFQVMMKKAKLRAMTEAKTWGTRVYSTTLMLSSMDRRGRMRSTLRCVPHTTIHPSCFQLCRKAVKRPVFVSGPLVKIRFLLMVRSKAAWIFMLCLPVGPGGRWAGSQQAVIAIFRHDPCADNVVWHNLCQECTVLWYKPARLLRKRLRQ